MCQQWSIPRSIQVI
nr:unnamed protein product [Callosobruchus analis]